MSELRPLDCTISVVAESLSQHLYCLQDRLSKEVHFTVAISAMELQKDLSLFRDLNISVNLDLNSNRDYNLARTFSHSATKPFLL